MAEEWAQHLKGKVIKLYSAEIISRELNPLTVAIMEEAAVDNISHFSSKDVGFVIDIPFDHVITLCSKAELSCPVFP